MELFDSVPEAPVQQHSAAYVEEFVVCYYCVHSDHPSPETWRITGHFAFILHSLKIEASPESAGSGHLQRLETLLAVTAGVVPDIQWVEVRDAAKYSNFPRCQGAPPHLVQERYAVQMPALSRWRLTAWD